MKRKVVSIVTLAVMALFVAAPFIMAQGAEPPAETNTTTTIWQAVTQFLNIVGLAKDGKWLPAIGLLLTLIIQIFKSTYFGGLITKIPQKFRFLVPTVAAFVLGCIPLIGSKGWISGLWCAIMVGPTSLLFHEILSCVPAYAKLKNG